jgi:hypothetical protein
LESNDEDDDDRSDMAMNYGLSSRALTSVQRLIEEHDNEIRKAWKAHFGG